MTLRDRLRERQTPSAAVALPGSDVGFTVRCIPVPEWEALAALHPDTDGPDWRLQVLAACVADDTGEQLAADEWAQLIDGGHLSYSEVEQLVNGAASLNSRSVHTMRRYDADPQFALEMAYCAPRGIPHSHFLGGPAVWEPDDRDKALAWQMREFERCPQCGTRPDEWDPKVGGHLHAYDASPDHCRGCEVLTGSRSEFERQRKAHRRGTEVRMRKIPEHERD